MANLKISQLTTYTGSVADQRWFVMNNNAETATFKYQGWASPFKYEYSQYSMNNAWDGTARVAGDYQMVIGGGNNSDINATNSPYCSIVGSTDCEISTKHNNKGYGTIIVGSSGSKIGGSSDSIANFGAGIYSSSSAENNGYFTAMIGAGSSVIRYGGDANNGTQFSVLAGGRSNTLGGLALESGMIGGFSNVLQQYRSAMIGGESLQMLDSGGSVTTSYRHSVMAGGLSNTMTQSNRSSIIGGSGNTMTTKVNAHMIGTNGRTASISDATFVENLVLFNYSNLNYADDTAAAAGGVVLGQIYHNSGALRVRIV